jgi:transposase
LELSKELLSILLPELLVDHFVLLKHELKEGKIHLHFEENDIVPEGSKERNLKGHGFHKEIMIQDFPLRGKQVYLHIKRRRWLDKSTKEVIQKDWDVVAKGSRMTVEFATFLKVLNRY